MLSQAVEDYLKTIYKIEDEEGSASTTEIARRLDVAPASVTSMVKRLADMGMVDYKSYQGAQLTDAGRKIALEIIRHHRLLETYLREIMGYSWHKMHEEAEHLEHHISEEFEDKIDQLLGYPTHDPHGDPIPTRDGEMLEHETQPLSEVPAGAQMTIRRFSDLDVDVLHQLEDAGLELRKVITVIDTSTESVIIDVETNRIPLSKHLASNVFVSHD